MNVANEIRREFLRSIVQRRITCAETGKVLDVNRCAVLIDPDGDPIDAYHESVLETITPAMQARITERGYRLAVRPFGEVR